MPEWCALAMTSIVSRKEHTMILPVSYERILAYHQGKDSRHVQEAFQDLNADQREFIMTGITPEERKSMKIGRVTYYGKYK